MGGEDQDQTRDSECADERVLEWEIGLPSTDDLTPLSQMLIPPELASAFSITPEPFKSMLDVNRASEKTIFSIRRQQSGTGRAFSSKLNSLPSFNEDREGDDNCDDGELEGDGNDGMKGKRVSERDNEESHLGLRPEDSNDDQSARTLKRPRLVWTPQLHKRFVDVVGHLGIKNAVPKTIMQLMNVEGLTRENVASHLQKYRLYLKRMQGLSNEGPSSSDHLFASTPVPQSLAVAASSYGSSHREESGHVPIPMPYGAPLLPVPVMGVGHGKGHMVMPASNNPGVYHGFESHPYNVFGRPVPHRPGEKQRDWSGNKCN